MRPNNAKEPQHISVDDEKKPDGLCGATAITTQSHMSRGRVISKPGNKLHPFLAEPQHNRHVLYRRCAATQIKNSMSVNVCTSILVYGQVTIIFVVSVCLFVCLFVCAEFFSAVFDPISIKLGHMLYVWA